jgi:uncharacterized membrane protein
MNTYLLSNTEKWIIRLVWIIFPAGVLWAYLGWFEWLMQHSSGILIAGVTLLGLLHIHRIQAAPLWYWVYPLMVFAGGMIAEIAGVATGFIFGDYLYGDTLGFMILGVPIAIGFAWVMMTRFSLNLFSGLKPLYRVPAAATLATLFDAVMEPAAVKLGFWTWNDGHIPWQNFTAWWILSLAFCYLLLPTQSKTEKASPYILHLFLVQIVYFILVLWIL